MPFNEGDEKTVRLDSAEREVVAQRRPLVVRDFYSDRCKWNCRPPAPIGCWTAFETTLVRGASGCYGPIREPSEERR